MQIADNVEIVEKGVDELSLSAINQESKSSVPNNKSKTDVPTTSSQSTNDVKTSSNKKDMTSNSDIPTTSTQSTNDLNMSSNKEDFDVEMQSKKLKTKREKKTETYLASREIVAGKLHESFNVQFKTAEKVFFSTVERIHTTRYSKGSMEMRGSDIFPVSYLPVHANECIDVHFQN